MVGLTVGKTNVTVLLKQKLRQLGKGSIALFEVPAQNHEEFSAESLRILITELGFECVYLSFSRPCSDLAKMLKTRGLDIDKIHFIDTISQMFGVKQASTYKCAHTKGPMDIDPIHGLMEDIFRKYSGERKCLFLDSVTSLLHYNSFPKTIIFMKQTAQTLKRMGIQGILVSTAKGGDTTDRLVKELGVLCDEIVTIA